MFYLPRVGDKGFYGLKTPYDELQNISLECISLKRLSELQSSIDTLSEIYLSAGLTETEHLNAENSDLQIASILKPDGTLIYLPVNYFSSYVQNNIVEYKTQVLCVNIGMIPKNIDSSHILEEMRIIASNLVGKEADVFVVEDKVNELITEEMHEGLELDRRVKIKLNDNPYKKITELEAKITELETYNSILEKSILENE